MCNTMPIPHMTTRNIVVSYANKTGDDTFQKHRPCEDAIYSREAPSFLFYGLADGQSGAKHGASGGYACLESIADYIQASGISEIMHTPFPDELPCMLVKEMRKRILSMAGNQNISYKEFASTLLAIAIDLRSGEYILLHLGDGCAVSIPRGGSIKILSAPENGFSLYHTWFTTSDSAVRHLRVAFGSIADKRRLLLMSDGADCFYRGININRKAEALLQYGSQEEILTHLRKAELADDACCIVMDISALEDP